MDYPRRRSAGTEHEPATGIAPFVGLTKSDDLDAARHFIEQAENHAHRASVDRVAVGELSYMFDGLTVDQHAVDAAGRAHLPPAVFGFDPGMNT